ncbi:hypothetical protein BDW62DRAFT_177158 [Aspergillus aurantiobrunneus]
MDVGLDLRYRREQIEIIVAHGLGLNPWSPISVRRVFVAGMEPEFVLGLLICSAAWFVHHQAAMKEGRMSNLTRTKPSYVS